MFGLGLPFPSTFHRPPQRAPGESGIRFQMLVLKGGPSTEADGHTLNLYPHSLAPVAPPPLAVVMPPPPAPGHQPVVLTDPAPAPAYDGHQTLSAEAGRATDRPMAPSPPPLWAKGLQVPFGLVVERLDTHGLQERQLVVGPCQGLTGGAGIRAGGGGGSGSSLLEI